jgi:coiled-coil domain-containing protein 55
MTEGKKYGLILPSKVSRNKAIINTTSVFGNDDDDDEDAHSAVNQNLKKEARSTLLRKQVQLQVEKALEADPTVYEYDNIYDDLQTKKAESDKRITSNIDRKPKYIGNLLKAAEQRKREMERRTERTVQKEREAEKGLYDDKEAFVTDAYRRKMQELRDEEERERLMEANADVTKQADLTGFYRNLLNQTAGDVPVPPQDNQLTNVKTEPDTATDRAPAVLASDDRGNRTGSDVASHATDAQRNRLHSKEDIRTASRPESGRPKSSGREGHGRKGRKQSSSDSNSEKSDDESGRQKLVDIRGSHEKHRHNQHNSDKSRHRDRSTKWSREKTDDDDGRGHKDSKMASRKSTDHKRRHSSSGDEGSDEREKRKRSVEKSTKHNKDEEQKSLKFKPSSRARVETDVDKHLGIEYDLKKRNMDEKQKECRIDKSKSGVIDTFETDSVSVSREVVKSQPGVSKMTVGNSLESARERYMARKAAIKVPVIQEDSD